MMLVCLGVCVFLHAAATISPAAFHTPTAANADGPADVFPYSWFSREWA